jgi:hypothetical protein
MSRIGYVLWYSFLVGIGREYGLIQFRKVAVLALIRAHKLVVASSLEFARPNPHW